MRPVFIDEAQDKALRAILEALNVLYEGEPIMADTAASNQMRK